MTTERWTDTALDRLVQTVAGIADLTEQNTRDISGLKTSVERLANIAEIHQQNFENIIVELQNQHTEIREIQTEVRGLQTENRRILDQLINRNNDGDN